MFYKSVVRDIMESVIQKATQPEGATRGRPPSFDADRVVAGAVDLFWANGFEATSLDDIQRALGVRASTLYNSFGGKEGLYRSAVETYLESTDTLMFAPLRDGDNGLDDLIALVERQRRSIARRNRPPGCLIVNAMVTGENSMVVERYTTLFRQAIGAACERAVEQGEISRDISQTLAASLLSSLLGASVTAKSGATAAALDAIYDGLAHTLNLHRATKPDRR